MITVVTDYQFHATWIASHTDYYLIPDEGMKLSFVEQGVEPDKIYVTGIPVSPKFWKRQPSNYAKIKLGFKEDQPLALVMGGGLGNGGIEEIVRTLNEYEDHIQAAVISGNNPMLYTKIQEYLRTDGKHNIRTFGFTDKIDVFMDAADFLITKPGGMTCTEALYKNLPMIFYQPIKGQEEGNSQLFTEKGWGVLGQNRVELRQLIDSWIHYPVRLHQIQRKQISYTSQYPPTILKTLLLSCLEQTTVQSRVINA